MSTSVQATKAKAKKTSSHPPYGDMIKKAIVELKERNGSSRQAIIKYLKGHYKLDEKVDHHVKRALLTGVSSGRFLNTKGTGASGSFKLTEKSKTINKSSTQSESAKSKIVTVKKTAVKKSDKKPAQKPKKVAAKKAKTPKVKKSPVKKPVKKVAIKKTPKTSPKKVVIKKTSADPKKATSAKPKKSPRKGKKN